MSEETPQARGRGYNKLDRSERVFQDVAAGVRGASREIKTWGVPLWGYARGHPVSGKKKKGWASLPIADAFAARDHTRERKIEEEGREAEEAEEVASALLLTRVVIRSVAGSRRAPAAAPVVVTAFKSCMLTMRAERDAGLRPREKGRASFVDGPHWHWPLVEGRRDLHHRRSRTPCCAERVEGRTWSGERSRLQVWIGSPHSDMGARDYLLGTALAAWGISTST
jgi:hypothetical protein